MRRSLLALVATASTLAATAIPAPAPAGAVVGGVEADIGEWPWQVALIVDGDVWCGGSLLSPTIVLTAAHCTEEVDPDEFEVVAGAVDLDDSSAQRRGVVGIDQHEDYDPVELLNDISLLNLDAPFVEGPDLTPVVLASAEESLALTEEGDAAVVTGFGAVGEEDDSSTVLLEGEVPTLGDARCNDLYGEDGDEIYADIQVCAGRDRGHVDACYGDSGGPLVVPTDDARTEWRQVGIVSWGAGCGQRRRPTVYTEVAAYADWLGARGVGPDAAESFEGTGARVPAHGTVGKADRYPLTIDVTGFEGPLVAVSVRLLGLHHTNPADLDVWLEAPDGTVVTLLSDVGGGDGLDGVAVLVLDGAEPADTGPLAAQVGPTDLEADEQRVGDAPPADLSVLAGIDPNGTWRLLLADDTDRAAGHLDAWALQLR